MVNVQPGGFLVPGMQELRKDAAPSRSSLSPIATSTRLAVRTRSNGMLSGMVLIVILVSINACGGAYGADSWCEFDASDN